MITIGLLIGAFIALVVDHNIEDQNFVTPLMLVVALGINIATIIIGIIVGFSIVSTCKKYVRIDKIKNSYADKLPNVFANRKRYLSSSILNFLGSFTICSFLFYTTGNIYFFVSIALTILFIVGITFGQVKELSFNSTRFVKYIITIILTLIAATITVKQINSLNVFILFYGFITVPNYIFPNQTRSSNTSKSNEFSGLAFSLNTASPIANGIVLAQAICIGSQKDSLGTVINEYISDAERLPLTIAIIACVLAVYVSRELAKYYKDAPEVITNNDKQNNKFAFVNIIIGAFIAVTRYNPIVFVVIVLLGMLAAAALRNNDNLRSLTIPSLLASGLVFG